MGVLMLRIIFWRLTMHPYQNSSLAMTGFIVDEGCLYAVLKGTDGDTKLYDKQALAWIISEARKAGTSVPNYENALQVLTTVNIQ